ncbi:hypothetical protein B9Z55_026631 [Caenorhabditis nigoni]|uniref:Uncharacterized protein n=1 Tax=Caenorhabditis nigoni TaxID=1611254 RepID=A0A2G5T3J8_9PELO|nr:hypothetical protein B9Z55_026631 [Caenorhabditis nigoni]
MLLSWLPCAWTASIFLDFFWNSIWYLKISSNRFVILRVLHHFWTQQLEMGFLTEKPWLASSSSPLSVLLPWLSSWRNRTTVLL